LSRFFTPRTFLFLNELAANNRRDWFEQNRSRYEDDVRTPALDFIAHMAPRLAAISPHFTAIPRTQGGSLMRVFRDTRFSRDKTPYKTNIGIHFRHEAGRDVHAPGFYMHIAPEQVFLAVGIWHPDAPALARIRTEIARYPRRWLAVRDDASFGRSFALSGNSLVRVPRGFDAAHPMAMDLRRKDFIGICPMLPESVIEADFSDFAAARFADGAPLMRFLCKALGQAY
jgi:uncharacterized protein (TIGR02453 family)